MMRELRWLEIYDVSNKLTFADTFLQGRVAQSDRAPDF
jgi:hypothetical protein